MLSSARWFQSTTLACFITSCLLTVTLANAQDASKQDSALNEPASPGLGTWVQRFKADRDALEFKYREPLSPEKKNRLVAFYRAYQADLKRIDPSQLDVAAAVDYALMENELTYQLAIAKLEAERDTLAMFWLPGVDSLVEMLEQHERLHTIDAKAAAELMVDVREQLAAAASAGQRQVSVEQAIAAVRAAEALQTLQRRLAAMHRFYTGYDPLYSWWCNVPYEQLVKQLEQSREAIRKAGGDDNDPDKIIGQPIGEAAMAIELQHELIPYSPAELIKIAEREFRWCDEQMLAASRE